MCRSPSSYLRVQYDDMHRIFPYLTYDNSWQICGNQPALSAPYISHQRPGHWEEGWSATAGDSRKRRFERYRPTCWTKQGISEIREQKWAHHAFPLKALQIARIDREPPNAQGTCWSVPDHAKKRHTPLGVGIK